MGLRYLLLGLALWGGYLIIRHLLGQQRDRRVTRRESKAVDSVECAHCGLHLPREEALRRDNDYFCCRDHLNASKPNKPAD